MHAPELCDFDGQEESALNGLRLAKQAIPDSTDLNLVAKRANLVT
jgi:hypothetical protein